MSPRRRSLVDLRGRSRLSPLQQKTLRAVELLQEGDRGVHLYKLEQALGRDIASGLIRTLRAMAKAGVVEEYVANPDCALVAGRRRLPFCGTITLRGKNLRSAVESSGAAP